jgi:hypothetical protein
MENKIQNEIVLWWNENKPTQRKMLFAVNNNSHNAIKGAMMKSLGVVNGVSDLILVLPNKVLFIEIKTATGKQSPHQIEFQKQIESNGFEYHIIKSLIEFKTLITKLNFTISTKTL